MSHRRRRTLIGLTLLSALCAQASFAGIVKINVTDKSSSAAGDTIVVFDPLDSMPLPSRNSFAIDQIDKRYSPRVSVIRTGTAVAFPNSDRIRHQVYSFSPAHPFSLKLYAGSPPVEEVFDKPGLVILGCNVHDTMVAFIGVVDSPYFAKIPASGKADLDLPPGRYRLRVWHPQLRSAIEPQQIIVAREPIAIPLTVDVDASREAAAPWPD